MAEEEKEKVFSRRDFLKTTGVATGGIIGGTFLGSVIGVNLPEDVNTDSTESQPESDSGSSPNAQQEVNHAHAFAFFTRQSDFDVLSAATERIFPSDDNGPGAVDLDVPYFIDKQLASTWGKNGNDYRMRPFADSDGTVQQSMLNRGEIFIEGLRAMNRVSEERHEERFEETSEENQDQILRDLEAGDIEMRGLDSGSFFTLLRNTTVEGVFSDPLYGGNKELGGWDMVEYPGSIASNNDMVDAEDFIRKDPITLAGYQGH